MKLTLLLIATLSAALPNLAQSTCYPNGRPVVARNPVTLQERFDASVPLDEYDNGVEAAVKWRALIRDEERSPHPSPERLARSYAWLASALGEGDHVAEGLAAAEKAERIIQDNGFDDAPFHSEVLQLLSTKEKTAGKATAAYDHAVRSRSLALRYYGHWSIEVEQAESAAGSAAFASGRYIDAERLIALAIEIAVRCRPSDSTTLQTLRFSHGVTLEQSGQIDAAVEEKRRTLDWAVLHLPIQSDILSDNLDSFGITLRNLGRLAEAEVMLRQAVDLQATYNKELYRDRARATMHLADVLQQEGQDAGAEALWLASFAFHLKSPNRSNPTAGSIAFRKAADAAEARGDIPLALERRRAAIADMAPSAPASHPELARARLELAATLAAAGHPRESANDAAAAIEIIRKSYPPSDPRRVISEVLFARVIAAVDGDEAGYTSATPYIAALETRLLDATRSRVELVKYGPVFASSFATYVGLALGSGHKNEAFQALQLANLTDIVLVNSEVAARSAAAKPETASLVQDLQNHIRLRQGLDSERSFAASSKDARALERLDAKIIVNDAQIATQGAEIDRLFPAFRALSRPTPVSLTSFQMRLRLGQVLLAPLPLADGTLAIAVTHDGLTWEKTTTTRAQIVQLVKRIRGSIDAAQKSTEKMPSFDGPAAAALYQAIAPGSIAAVMKTHPSLLYYNAGVLASLPPSLLITAPPHGAALARAHWLVRTHAITILSTLLSRTEAHLADGVAATRFLGVGAPDLGPAPLKLASRGLEFRSGQIDTKTLRALRSLPGAQGELRAIGRALGGQEDRLLIGGEATEAALRSLQLDHYNVIAFATHGLISGDFAGLTEPALVLTPPSTPSGGDDGLLTASEISGLRLDADWVILSACNSASGTGVNSPAYGGLASAFVHAGARALLVSHWPVREDAAEAITVGTVSATAHGIPRDRALQLAMIKLLANRRVPQSSHPAVWAPFVLLDR